MRMPRTRWSAAANSQITDHDSSPPQSSTKMISNVGETCGIAAIN
ncbi:hypothetical protein I548_1062 [Mycobacterium intracellulare]|nr:hypothetical protein I548_1062 [Mycobacterium intracellulare]